MRIISKFHDYYDCGQKYGQDLSLIYLRHPRVDVYRHKLNYEKNETYKKEPFPFPVCYGVGSYNENNLDSLRQYIVGFCGKIYPILAARTPASNDPVFCAHLEAIDKFIESHYKKRQIDEYYNPKRRARYWFSMLCRKSIKAFFDKCAEEKESFDHLFVENKSPVFVAESLCRPGGDIEYNASLKKVEFYRLFDPQTAYQEISMYLGSTLAQPVKEIPDISDEIMRDIKGFNAWSFKKPPGTKKRGKKK